MCCQLLSATETRWVGKSDISLSEVLDNFAHLKGKLIESLDKQLSDKGAEINGYMEKHNIQLRDQQVITHTKLVSSMTKI